MLSQPVVITTLVSRCKIFMQQNLRGHIRHITGREFPPCRGHIDKIYKQQQRKTREEAENAKIFCHA
jgi:hypothetical protein